MESCLMPLWFPTNFSAGIMPTTHPVAGGSGTDSQRRKLEMHPTASTYMYFLLEVVFAHTAQQSPIGNRFCTSDTDTHMYLQPQVVVLASTAQQMPIGNRFCTSNSLRDCQLQCRCMPDRLQMLQCMCIAFAPCIYA